jgi:hypothetical protein
MNRERPMRANRSSDHPLVTTGLVTTGAFLSLIGHLWSRIRGESRE